MLKGHKRSKVCNMNTSHKDDAILQEYVSEKVVSLGAPILS